MSEILLILLLTVVYTKRENKMLKTDLHNLNM